MSTERLHASPPSQVAIIGCGHVGLVYAAGLARLGHTVVGLDRRAEHIRSLQDGQVPFHEEGLTALVAEGLASGRLRFSTTYQDAVPQADFIFLTVDTPMTLGGAADLRNLRAAARSIAGSLNGKMPVVVNKSTSPVGTSDAIEAILGRSGGALHHPRVVANPEFLQQGRAVQDFFAPERIVIGARSDEDARAVADLYAGVGGRLLLTDVRTAEMIKYVANSFLATRISFINEIARICEAAHVEVDDVVAGVAHDPRIGDHFFRPGIGYGGSCLPKDIAALRFMGDSLGVGTPFLAAVQHVNDGQRMIALRTLSAALGGLDGKTIAVWGVTFKGDTEDARISPAVDVVRMLINEGADVRIHDPSSPLGLPDGLVPLLHHDPLEVTRGADALAVLAEWRQFRDIPLDQVRASMRGDVLLDGRNLLDPAAAIGAGFRYLAMGRGRSSLTAATVDATVDSADDAQRSIPAGSTVAVPVGAP